MVNVFAEYVFFFFPLFCFVSFGVFSFFFVFVCLSVCLFFNDLR